MYITGGISHLGGMAPTRYAALFIATCLPSLSLLACVGTDDLLCHTFGFTQLDLASSCRHRTLRTPWLIIDNIVDIFGIHGYIQHIYIYIIALLMAYVILYDLTFCGHMS